MKNIFLVLLQIWVGFNLNAQPNQIDGNGKKQGAWQKNYPGSNVPQYAGQFLDDLPIGIFIYYFESGQKKAEIHHGLPNNTAAVKLYFENGQILSDGFYKNGRKDSLWYSYAITGELICAENYKNDVLEGKCVYYFKEGQYLENKLQIQQITHFHNGEPNGTYQEYFYNGNLKMSGSNTEGEKNGLWTEYYNSGEQMVTINYKNNLQHGWATYFDKSGEVKNKIMYRKGRALSEKELSEFLNWCREHNQDPNL